MDLLLLLKTLYDLRDLVGDLLDTFGVSKQCFDSFLVVPHLVLSLLKLLIAWVVVSLLTEIFNLLLEDICPLLEVHDL